MFTIKKRRYFCASRSIQRRKLGETTTLENPLIQIRQAITQMQDINPTFSDLLQITIHTIFSSPSKLAGGGSTSTAIGCIWACPRPHWTDIDVLEFLVHETTHNLVFVDELCHSHYTNYNVMLKPENFARSAILSKPRPLDKVFHSIIVSLEVLLFRKDHWGHPENPCLHPPTTILMDQVRRSIDSIFESKAIQNLLTSRAISLLRQCEDKLGTIKSHQLCGATSN